MRAHDDSAATPPVSRPAPFIARHRQPRPSPSLRDANRCNEARDVLVVSSDASDAKRTAAPRCANNTKDRIDTGRRRPYERGSYEPRRNIGCRRSASRGKTADTEQLNRGARRAPFFHRRAILARYRAQALYSGRCCAMFYKRGPVCNTACEIGSEPWIATPWPRESAAISKVKYKVKPPPPRTA
ncbi:hypothetical protein HDG34_007001 [Paraburkholderia sp. HC6.4b]|nr:hypothetical protein [Paraburkholderia sp. HC6.4b]MBB5455238.1 hypothetical protein [Paraburkholderia sp. Kb1A]